MAFDPTNETACLDGKVMRADQAKIPVLDEGLLRGDGVFEVIRMYGGKAFAFEDHLVRLDNSAESLRLPIDLDLIREECNLLIEAIGDKDGLLRIVLTRGGHRLLLSEPLPERPEILTLASVSYQPPLVLNGAKSLSYAANSLARRLAQEKGCDDAVLVNPEDHILEAPTASIFWVRNDAVFTPPLGEHILASITRNRVMRAWSVTEQSCTLTQLGEADELFLASTVREVHPVKRLDDNQFDAPGRITTEIAASLNQLITNELEAT